jgi:hypothetical protein
MQTLVYDTGYGIWYGVSNQHKTWYDSAHYLSGSLVHEDVQNLDAFLHCVDRVEGRVENTARHHFQVFGAVAESKTNTIRH